MMDYTGSAGLLANRNRRSRNSSLPEAEKLEAPEIATQPEPTTFKGVTGSTHGASKPSDKYKNIQGIGNPGQMIAPGIYMNEGNVRSVSGGTLKQAYDFQQANPNWYGDTYGRPEATLPEVPQLAPEPAPTTFNQAPGYTQEAATQPPPPQIQEQPEINFNPVGLLANQSLPEAPLPETPQLIEEPEPTEFKEVTGTQPYDPYSGRSIDPGMWERKAQAEKAQKEYETQYFNTPSPDRGLLAGPQQNRINDIMVGQRVRDQAKLTAAPTGIQSNSQNAQSAGVVTQPGVVTQNDPPGMVTDQGLSVDNGLLVNTGNPDDGFNHINMGVDQYSSVDDYVRDYQAGVYDPQRHYRPIINPNQAFQKDKWQGVRGDLDPAEMINLMNYKRGMNYVDDRDLFNFGMDTRRYNLKGFDYNRFLEKNPEWEAMMEQYLNDIGLASLAGVYHGSNVAKNKKLKGKDGRIYNGIEEYYKAHNPDWEQKVQAYLNDYINQFNYNRENDIRNSAFNIAGA